MVRIVNGDNSTRSAMMNYLYTMIQQPGADLDTRKAWEQATDYLQRNYSLSFSSRELNTYMGAFEKAYGGVLSEDDISDIYMGLLMVADRYYLPLPFRSEDDIFRYFASLLRRPVTDRLLANYRYHLDEARSLSSFALRRR